MVYGHGNGFLKRYVRLGREGDGGKRGFEWNVKGFKLIMGTVNTTMPLCLFVEDCSIRAIALNIRGNARPLLIPSPPNQLASSSSIYTTTSQSSRRNGTNALLRSRKASTTVWTP